MPQYSKDDILGIPSSSPGQYTDEEIFGWVAEQAERPRQKFTAVESGGLGAIQGLSFDTADEIESGARALYEVATGPDELKDLLKKYRHIRDKEVRPRYDNARQDNPKSYMTGEIGGSVATSFVPGLGVLNAGKGSKLLTTIGKGALSGGLAGAGASEADLTKGDVENFAEDVGSGAFYGGATSGVMKGGMDAISSLSPRNVVKKGANILLNTPEELTELRLDRGKDAIMNAPKRHELVGEYKDILEKLKRETIEGSKEARAQLDGVRFKGSEVGAKAGKIAGSIDERLAGIDDDPGRVAARGWLRDIEEMYKGKPEVTGSKVKDSLQTIQRSADYDVGGGKFVQVDDAAKKELGHELRMMLEGKSPAYAADMKKVAADSSLLEKANNLGSDKTLANLFRKIETDEWGSGQFPREILEQIDGRMGTDILDKAKLSYAREAFDKNITQGSMNVNKFRNMMEGIPVIGRMAGLVGASVDKYGRSITMGAIDAAGYLEQVYKKSGAPGFVEKARPFMEQAKRGNYAAAVAIQMMKKTYPELQIESEEPKE